METKSFYKDVTKAVFMNTNVFCSVVFLNFFGNKNEKEKVSLLLVESQLQHGSEHELF